MGNGGHMMRLLGLASCAVAGICLWAFAGEESAPAQAKPGKYQVGPAREYKTLQEVAAKLAPGDTVEVDGDAKYPGDLKFTVSGTAEKPITVKGIRVNGKRPLIEGGDRTVEFRLSNYMVFEGFEVAGGKRNGIYHHAAFITVRDTLVRDCPGQGIIGADNDSGSCTLQYVEVARCGSGLYSHPIYMSTDPVKFPGSVFRMEHCYVHDGNGGNAVKSRAERNEIYYNCIEAGFYRELEMIGRDSEAGPRPMNSDVVGNLFIKKSEHPVVRIGHDSKGLGSRGRYRFVNNTFVLSPQSKIAIQAYGKLESVEMHNNVFCRAGGGPVQVLNEDNAEWLSGKRVVAGLNNWVTKGSEAPGEWKGTIEGTEPGFVNAEGLDFHIGAKSPLVNAGTIKPESPEGYAFPNPLFPPVFEPPLHVIEALDVAPPLPDDGKIDIGAYEFVGRGAAR
jgi:hypothetical protein